MKTKEELIAFEEWTCNTFNEGKLKSPVHLNGSIDGKQEDELIKIFENIKPQDWVFTTYRSHYHALLKGVPEQRLKDWILDNKSIHFMDSEYKVFSSAIVGGTLPIALGVAMAIKKKSKIEVGDLVYKNGEGYHKSFEPHVYCFIGDMTASLGVFNDCISYAIHNDLPITFIIEDNGLSTDTKTHEVWGMSRKRFDDYFKELQTNKRIKYYKYERKYPHYGTGKFIANIWKDIVKEDDVKNKGF